MHREIFRNLKKDFAIEYRSRTAINISIAFAGISTLAISLVSRGVPLQPEVMAVFFWIILFFSAMNGLSHIFTREVEEGTELFLRINTKAESVYISKLIFNILFFWAVQLVVVPLYIFFLQAWPEDGMLFLSATAAGGVAIASGTTLLAAMVARAGGKGSLFTIISFPILLPVLWIAIITTSLSLRSTGGNGWGNVVFLLAFSGFIIVISFLLFRSVWMDL